MATGQRLTELTDREAVLQAMKEFRQLGRDKFIEKYSTPEVAFDRSNRFFVIHDGIGYDSKPLAAAAFGLQHGTPLHSNDFSGGNPVKVVMSKLGFKVVDWTSPRLVTGDIYTREYLRETFKINDATLNTGVFQPLATNSVWLFVTKDKTSDRTPYQDHLEGDLLKWQGQTAGRTDSKIINHEQAGDELLVFYRNSKREHKGAGFRYEGPFRYVNHTGGAPTNFVLQRWSIQEDVEAPQDSFDPDSVADGRKKVWAEIKRRQGQAKFRRGLLRAYAGKCAVTGCAVEPILEAAHIRPYVGTETNVTCNGLLLRADLHTLFDLGLICVNHAYCLDVADRLSGTEYEKLAGHKLKLPSVKSDWPSEQALAWHRKEHDWD
jgi:putative restriction endonuclease